MLNEEREFHRYRLIAAEKASEIQSASMENSLRVSDFDTDVQERYEANPTGPTQDCHCQLGKETSLRSNQTWIAGRPVGSGFFQRLSMYQPHWREI